MRAFQKLPDLIPEPPAHWSLKDKVNTYDKRARIYRQRADILISRAFLLCYISIISVILTIALLVLSYV